MARQPRTQEVQQERRRRSAGTLDRMAQLKLAVPEQVQEDHKDYALRWINDTGNRMHHMTVQDDWDRVDGVEPVPVGTDKEGRPILARLCKKRREYWEEDQGQKMAGLREQEEGLMRGAKSDPNDDRSDDVSYVPAGNSITTGYTP